MSLYDPRERIERERRRIRQMTDPQSYLPPQLRRPLRLPRPESDSFSLKDEDRRSLLSSISQATMGSLYKFGNVLDLPASSMRDVLSTVTGTPRNPFDQWLSPTQDTNRITPRELLRQWDWIGPQDTWGNLAGSIAFDIAIDPLTWLGLGAGAYTKHGQLLKKAGVLDQLPDYLAKVGPRYAAQTGSRLGRRRALQGITSAEDIFKHMMPDSAQRYRQMLNETAERFGYHGQAANIMGQPTMWESPYQAFLKSGDAGHLKGLFRVGAPNWRAFGASPTQRLRQSPGFLVGTPGSQNLKRWAAGWDTALGGLAATAPLRELRRLVDPRVQETLGTVAQPAAEAYTARRTMADMFSRDVMRMTIEDFGTQRGVGWMDALTDGLEPAQQTQMHDLFRRMFEVRDLQTGQGITRLKSTGGKPVRFAMTDVDRQAVSNVMGHLASVAQRSKALGLKLDWLDDDFVEYFPRQLTEVLRSKSVKQMKTLHEVAGLPASAFNMNMLARHGILRDIPATPAMTATERINHLFQHPAVKQIRESPLPESAKLERLKRVVSDAGIPDEYRSGTLGRARVGMPADEALALSEKEAWAYGEKTFSDIIGDASLSEADKAAAVQARLLERGMRVDAKWGAAAPGYPNITKKTRVWEMAEGRHAILAEMLLKAPEETLERGLFGNFPLWDLSKYLERMEDSLNKGEFTMDVLRNPLALHKNAPPAAQAGVTIRTALMELGFDADEALKPLMRVHQPGIPVTDDALRRFGMTPLAKEVSDDLTRFQQLFEDPGAPTLVGKFLDSLQAIFKANVTSPFPAFHVRNHVTGILRNKVGGMFSMKSYQQATAWMMGKPLKGLETNPIVQQEFAKLQRRMGHFAPQTLTEEAANNVMQGLAYETGLMGPLSYAPNQPAITDVRTMGGGDIGPQGTAGSARAIGEHYPGSVGWSPKHAARSYFGLKQPGEQAAQTTGAFPGFAPFPTFTLPFWLAGKGIGKGTRRVMGEAAPGFAQRWADMPFWNTPNLWRVRGAYEAMGAKGAASMPYSETGKAMYGPVRGGEEVGHLVEGMNRYQPWLKLVLEDGMDPREAAKLVKSAQIEYASKGYTSFERKVLKRMIPFYSFNSRSIPWAMRMFYEEPHNILRQVIRGTTEYGKQRQRALSAGQEGAVPPYVRDTLAIPLHTDVPDVQRFLTGADVMSQGLWQFGMPLMSGDFGDFGAELASASNPLLVKLPIEAMTGVSLWQRDVEGGRALRNLSPPLGRTLANVGQTWEKLTGNKPPPGYYAHVLRDPGLFEQLVAASPYSRMLSTARKATDIRKGLGAKAASLLGSVQIRDIGPLQQQAILRDHLKSMLLDVGGSTFEKAVLSRRALEQMSPAQQYEAMKVKALIDEQAEVAKTLRERARQGYPGY